MCRPRWAVAIADAGPYGQARFLDKNCVRLCAEVGGQAFTKAELLELVRLAPDHPRREIERRQTIGNSESVNDLQGTHLRHQ